MGTKRDGPKDSDKEMGQTSGGQSSEASSLGRELTLVFADADIPNLEKIEFRWSASSEARFWQRGDKDNPLRAAKLAKVIAYAAVGYLAAETQSPKFHFSIRGPQRGGIAATLGDAISQKDNSIHQLLGQQLPSGWVSRASQIFGGENVAGTEANNRVISISSVTLPADCVKIIWFPHGSDPLTDEHLITDLARRLRRAIGLPDEDPILKRERKKPETTPAPKPRDQIRKSNAAQEGSPTSATELFGEDLVIEVFPKTIAEQRSQPRSDPTQAPQTPVETSSSRERPEEKVASRPPKPAIPPIPSHLFQIHNPTGLRWEDSMPLINFGRQDDTHDIWRLRDACGGVLILGAPRSGKTSGSGFLLSTSMLRAGFGGLVMTVKTQEAERWKRLCERFGRANDCLVIKPGCPHRLNVLAYEAQRPNREIGLTEDLINIFRVLIDIVSQQSNGAKEEKFWYNSVNAMMQGLFNAYLLSGEPMTVQGLREFVVAADNADGQIESDHFCAPIIEKAKNRAQTEAQKAEVANCINYWTREFYKIPNITRAGIVTSFSSMAAVLTSPGIHELVSSETTLTPECILSGKIVILDLSTKQHGAGAILVQAAWKYLFQKAIEWRPDKELPTARPVFLWEDEGHEFFSEHDEKFQPTARDCRAVHVVISQNLHNFLHRGHNPHKVHAVFAATNTQIFHTNGDPDTNEWASKKFGTHITLRTNVSISSEPKPRKPTPTGFFESFSFWPDTPQEKASVSMPETRESAVQPEDFQVLKMGGDGTCDAYVLWVGHKFKINGRHYRLKTFAQDDEQRPKQS